MLLKMFSHSRYVVDAAVLLDFYNHASTLELFSVRPTSKFQKKEKFIVLELLRGVVVSHAVKDGQQSSMSLIFDDQYSEVSSTLGPVKNEEKNGNTLV